MANSAPREIMKLTIAFIYGVLFSISFLICASVWHWQMEENFFVSQKGLLRDFLPPFIRSGQSGNFFIRPTHVIYSVWCIYLAIMVLVPAGVTWLVVRLHRRAVESA